MRQKHSTRGRFDLNVLLNIYLYLVEPRISCIESSVHRRCAAPANVTD